jgi:hypothetical protein
MPIRGGTPCESGPFLTLFDPISDGYAPTQVHTITPGEAVTYAAQGCIRPSEVIASIMMMVQE